MTFEKAQKIFEPAGGLAEINREAIMFLINLATIGAIGVFTIGLLMMNLNLQEAWTKWQF